MAALEYDSLLVETARPREGAEFGARWLSATASPLPDGSWEMVRTISPPARTVYRDTGHGDLSAFRLHGDVSEARLAELAASGADVVESADHDWYVVTDPGLGEVRLFPQFDEVEHFGFDIVYEVPEPKLSARWWARVLGANVDTAADGSYSRVHPFPRSPFAGLVLARGTQPPRGTRRVRMRFVAPDITALVVSGASVLDRLDPMTYRMSSPHGVEWDVRHDPSRATAPLRTRW